MDTFYVPQSAVAGAVWPTVPSPRAAMLVALLAQLNDSQWWPHARLRAKQSAQLSALIHHALETTDFYPRHFRGVVSSGHPLTMERWPDLPLLTRNHVQTDAEALTSRAVPEGHGALDTIQTSGSTGEPIRVTRTRLNGLMWSAFTVRDHLWHRRHLSGKLAGIRDTKDPAAVFPHGQHGRGWGDSSRLFAPSAPVALLSLASPVEQQMDWLAREDPDYLITFPSNLARVVALARERGQELGRLKSVMTLSEVVSEELRRACRDVWHVGVEDMYSSREMGYMALQCPDHDHYHVQSEGVLLEVLDEAGQPCAPGETGHIVATNLHNFAMPLIRYAIGDYAEVGPPCPCGRGLPVLSRILGRVHNMVVLPTGGRHFPQTAKYGLTEIAPVRQFQIRQPALERIELHLVVRRPLTDDEEAGLRSALVKHMGYDFTITLHYHDDALPLGPGGKIEPFVSKVSAEALSDPRDAPKHATADSAGRLVPGPAPERPR